MFFRIKDYENTEAIINKEMIVAIEKIIEELDERLKGKYRLCLVDNRVFYINEDEYKRIFNEFVNYDIIVDFVEDKTDD